MDIHGENNDEKIEKAIKKLEDFWMNIGLPFNYEQLGMLKEDIDDLISKMGFSKENEYIGNYVKLTKEDVKHILEIE